MRGIMKQVGDSSTFLSNFSWFQKWQLILNIGVFLAALVMGTLVTQRAFFLIALIPLAFLPFSYARVRLQTLLDGLLSGRESTTTLLLVLTGLGIACDVVMIAQLFTARAGTPNPLLHGPGISWIGAIWFSAHGLLFLGYMIIRPVQWTVRFVRQMVQPHSTSAPDTLVSPERRQFLQHVGVLGAGANYCPQRGGHDRD